MVFIPINGTLNIATLSQEKFGLDIIINYLHQATAQEGIQVDQYKDTNDVKKSVKAKEIEKISNDLQHQGYIMKEMWSLGNEQLKKLWVDVRDILPSNIYNSTTRYMNNTLAKLKNILLWGKAIMDTCLPCKENSPSLLHVVLGCKVHLEQGRYTWRHNSILATLLRSIDGLRGWRIFADIPGYHCPHSCHWNTEETRCHHSLSREDRSPLELTYGFVTNVKENV